MLRDGSLAVGPMVSARVPVEEAPEAYRRLVDALHESIAVVLEYPAKRREAPKAAPTPSHRHRHAIGLRLRGG